MSLLQKLAQKISEDSSGFVQFAIPPSRVKEVQYDSSPIKPGSGYFRIWAVEMRVNAGGLLTTYYPTLHSVVNFIYNGASVELTQVTGLESLRTSVGSNFEMNRVVTLNHRLTELVPFNGGTVEISAGLLAMKEKDRVQAAIKMAGDFSTLLAVPQLSHILKIAEPLAKNVEQILGLGESKFQVGYHNTFTGPQGGGSNDLAPQYIAIIAANPEDHVSREGEVHWVIKDHLCYIDPNNPTSPPQDIPRDYILLRIEARRSREEEWNNLTDINQPFVEALKLVKDSPQQGERLLNLAISRVWESPDIAENDRDKIAERIKEKYEARSRLYKGAAYLGSSVGDKSDISLASTLVEIGL